MSLRLNLGAADRHVEGFVSVDIAPPADHIVDLSGPWPWEDSSVDEVLAMDLIEHVGDCDHVSRWVCGRCEKQRTPLPIETEEYIDVFLPDSRHQIGRIHFMNELYRVLKPGARATIETPNASRGCGYFQDPTHVSPWCLSTFKYFEHCAFAHTRLAKPYGITAAFRIISLSERETPGECGPEKALKITAILEAVK